jgi:hypothetical protein
MFIESWTADHSADFSLEGRRGDTEAWKPAPVMMLIQFSAFDERSAGLDDPANVVPLGEKLARSMYGCIA